MRTHALARRLACPPGPSATNPATNPAQLRHPPATKPAINPAQLTANILAGTAQPSTNKKTKKTVIPGLLIRKTSSICSTGAESKRQVAIEILYQVAIVFVSIKLECGSVTSVSVAEPAQPATVKIDALTQDIDAPSEFSIRS